MPHINTDPFYALADPSRRTILQLLHQEKLPVNALADQFNMSRPAVSKHLKILYVAGFIRIEQKGRERYCQLAEKGFEAIQEWFAYFEAFWKEKGQNLSALMKAKEKAPD